MSGDTAYPLELHKPKSIPFSLESSSFDSPPTEIFSPRTIPYEYPSPISPPQSPKRSSRVISPSGSSGYVGRSSTPRSPRATSPRQLSRQRPTPPPSGNRHRSTTPSGIAPDDLEKFAKCCRACYFHHDEEAGRQMTQTLATISPSQRASFSRLQASIRSAYHRSVNARKNAEFRAHLSSTQPGASLTPAVRSHPQGPLARIERLERFDKFVRTWCTMGMPGTQPFFTVGNPRHALWGLMELQQISESKGGAGGQRIQWILDDAVFKESAGKDFMLEAIDVLKGVLGFEECPSSTSTGSLDADSSPPVYTHHTDAALQPLSSPAVIPKRPRAPSDPFLDTPALSHSVGTMSTSSSNNDVPVGGPSHEEDRAPSRVEPARSDFFDVPEEEFMRIWTAPDLVNSEYKHLARVFPSFITRHSLPPFPVANARARQLDLEEGFDDDGSMEVRIGTGTLLIGPKARSDGWQGSWWRRFIDWVKRTFACA
ncbi:hypothetical protein FISHEDRAFT_42039 [Fistulina hepatica ATCC 64428]|uniref:Uncharacterized protein n=1 Tax=Fistulina hepatica ATCC 64428 TaxID=1128425 RepID=A0A0D7AEH5_9AGAR|nr:hypothetical protein FISHEDRAFT_42039 [Fistulina hepatica ATCC 64428]